MKGLDCAHPVMIITHTHMENFIIAYTQHQELFSRMDRGCMRLLVVHTRARASSILVGIFLAMWLGIQKRNCHETFAPAYHFNLGMEQHNSDAFLAI